MFDNPDYFPEKRHDRELGYYKIKKQGNSTFLWEVFALWRMAPHFRRFDIFFGGIGSETFGDV